MSASIYRPRSLALISVLSLSLAVAGCVQAAPPADMTLPLTTHTLSGTTPLVLTPATGTWDFSSYESLMVRVKNTSDKPVTVWASAENEGAKNLQDNVRTAAQIEAGQTATLQLRLMRRSQDPTYAPFKPFFMYYKNINVRDATIDPSQIARVSVRLDSGSTAQSVQVESISAVGQGTPLNPPFVPFVDKYGQYTHADWPDKIYSDADFAARLQKEKAEMSAYPGAPDWDSYGGWSKGPKQKATGYFYPTKVDGKWWLVDPTGSLYWSYGPTGVGAGGEGSPVTGKESWFTQLPPQDGPLQKYWGEGKGARYMYYEDGKAWKSFDFGSSNAERKYGPDWRAATADFMHNRLRNWGFNTIANWSDFKVYLQHKTPYVVAIHYGGPWLEHIPDVFDPAFATAVNERMDKEKDTTAGDAWNIGYFVDNELTWGYKNKAEVAITGALRATPTSVTKRTLIADLKAKYPEIAALNAAWGADYASWDAMLQGKEVPEAKNANARSEDLGAFGIKFADKYFSTVRAAVKRVAPNNLYLGCRFHGHIDTEIIKVAAKYADVVSWNVYEEPGSRLNRFINVVDKPFIVGEFGIGSDQGQTPFRGDTLTEDPNKRVASMENWVRNAVVHPLVVGGHYFQFRDQPITGRPDGEATLRGFVNTADTPHFELVQANRRLGYNLYTLRSTGQLPSPYAKQPIRGPIGVGTWATQAEFKDIHVTQGAKNLFQSDLSRDQGWKMSNGDWKIADGVLRQSGVQERALATIGDPTWSNYTLNLKARKTGGNEGFLIVFGPQDDGNKSWWNLGGWGNTKSALELPGASTAQTPQTIELNRWYDIRVEVQGPTVKCYLDNKLIQQATR
ncbi:hypothetical protein EON83_00540 [bacterium]|nr:MAG: hypothetical protein EON83_00540 [bacterium]